MLRPTSSLASHWLFYVLVSLSVVLILFVLASGFARPASGSSGLSGFALGDFQLTIMIGTVVSYLLFVAYAWTKPQWTRGTKVSVTVLGLPAACIGTTFLVSLGLLASRVVT
jgi:hypothetical protein